MNQQIQLQDGFRLEDEGLLIDAMVAGQVIHCYLVDIPAAHADSFYQAYQFDIEEYLTETLQDECWDEKGHYYFNLASLGLNISI